jgi:hypothetical protein
VWPRKILSPVGDIIWFIKYITALFAHIKISHIRNEVLTEHYERNKEG